MSSHHIVRENQEPALLIIDFKSLDLESIGQLLEWSPTIITDVDNMDFLLSEGIKVDIVYGAEHDPIQEAIAYLPQKVNVVVDALEYLIAHNFKAVNILGDVSTVVQDYIDRLNIVFFSQNIRYTFFKKQFEKWKAKRSRIFITEGKLNSFEGISLIAPNVFETSSDGFFKIKFNTTDWVLIGEEV